MKFVIFKSFIVTIANHKKDAVQVRTNQNLYFSINLICHKKYNLSTERVRL